MRYDLLINRLIGDFFMLGQMCLQVSKALSDEIRRLSVLVDEFHAPFHSDNLVLQVGYSHLITFAINHRNNLIMNSR